jgi:hypothetical protein
MEDEVNGVVDQFAHKMLIISHLGLTRDYEDAKIFACWTRRWDNDDTGQRA